MKPTFPPFEVHTSADGIVTETWRHPDGKTEQWSDGKFVYGPNPPQDAAPVVETPAPAPAENTSLPADYKSELEKLEADVKTIETQTPSTADKPAVKA